MNLSKLTASLINTIAILGIVILVSSCSTENETNGYVSISGRKFIDPQGREILFHGVNLVNKNPEVSFADYMKQEDFDKMYSWGFNCVRLGFTWSGIEPEPGVFNEEYLEGLDGAIERAKKAGLYIILDMHQDLYSQLYSDGAPEWATMHEGQEHITGEIWSDSYLISPAVQKSYDNFWANTLAPDGVGLMDHFANVWKILAERYAEETIVIGFDILNEPFMGSSVNMVMPLMIGAYAQMLKQSGQPVLPMEELGELWGQVASRLEILKTLQDIVVYSQIMASIVDISQEFEKGPLSIMYQKVRDQIREVNDHHIIFLEHNYFSNTGVPAAFKLPIADNGEEDKLLAYAPHGYDLVVDTEGVDDPANSRVEYIFNQAYNTADRLGTPMLVGEWGAFGGDRPGYLEAGKFIVSRFEKLLCSETYWHYEKDADKTSFFGFQHRFYPERVSGKIVSYKYDVDNGGFNAQWMENGDSKAVNRFYVPNLKNIQMDKINIIPMSDVGCQIIEGTDSGWLMIKPMTSGGERLISYLK